MESTFLSFLIIFSSFLSFFFLKSILGLILNRFKLKIFLKLVDSECWKFQNTLVSFIHSSLSGLWSAYCLFIYPQFLKDVVVFFKPLGFYAICFTEGYFLYDLIDIFANQHLYNRSCEIFLHHLIVLNNFFLSISMKQFTGAMLICLISELHNVLLHLRTLTRMSKVDEKSSIYQFISFFNIVTLLSFRTVPYLFLFYHLFKCTLYQEPFISPPILLIFWLTLILLFVYHILLLWRTFVQDFYNNYNVLKNLQSGDSNSNYISNAQNGFINYDDDSKCYTNGFKAKAH